MKRATRDRWLRYSYKLHVAIRTLGPYWWGFIFIGLPLGAAFAVGWIIG